MPIEMLIPERLRSAHRSGFIRFVETGAIGPGSRGMRVPALRRDGTEVDVELTVSPFRTLHGQDLVAASIRTVTSAGVDRDRIMGLLESLGGVLWEVDADTLEPVFVSDGASELLARPLADLRTGIGPWAAAIDPRDRDETLAWRRRAASAAADRTDRADRADRADPVLSWDYRVITDGGGERWVRDRVVALEDAGACRLLGLSVDITREQRTVRRREARARVSVALSTATSLREVAPVVIAALADGWGWDAGALWSLDASGELGAVRSWTASPARFGAFDELTRQRTFRRGVGLPGRVWETGAPAWIADIHVDDNLPRARVALGCGLHSCVGLPIFLGDEFIGVLEFFGGAVRRVEPETIEDLQAVVAQIALFIDRRRADDDLLFQKALLEWQSEAALDAMIVVSDDGRVLSYNQRFAEMSDIGSDTLTAGNAQQILDRALHVVADPAAFAELLAGVRGDGKPRRAELALIDGRFVDCYVASLPYPIGGTYARAWYFRDITDRKRAENELRGVAETLERSLLPPITPAIPGLEVATRHRYAAAGRDIGGDFYDVFRTGPGWGVVIGDVCGKGAPAASLTGLVRYTTRVAAMGDATPDEVLAVVNEAVLREPGDDRLCTLAYARLQVGSGRVVADVAVGGHPLPLVLRADGAVEPLGRPGTVLGAVSASDATTMTTILGRHDALVLYTDGVTEARRGDEFFDVPRLVDLLKGLAGAGAEEIAERVMDTALEFQGNEPRDDIAVVALRVP
jgi:PAS domain S-box-containing protein